MNNEIAEQFRSALNFLLHQEGRGAQVRLAVAQNIDRGYLNAVVKGRKPAAEEIRLKIADHFGMLYEEMLAFGRRVQEELVKTEKGKGADGSDVEVENKPGNDTSSKIEQVREMLESGTAYDQVLTGLINNVLQTILAGTEKQDVSDRLKAIEGRLVELEKKIAGSSRRTPKNQKK